MEKKRKIEALRTKLDQERAQRHAERLDAMRKRAQQEIAAANAAAAKNLNSTASTVPNAVNSSTPIPTASPSFMTLNP